MHAHRIRSVIHGAAIALVALAALSAQTGKPVPWKGFQRAEIAERTNIKADSDGTLHWGPRMIPLPAMASKELNEAYMKRLNQALANRSNAALDPEAYRRRMAEAFAAKQEQGGDRVRGPRGRHHAGLARQDEGDLDAVRGAKGRRHA